MNKEFEKKLARSLGAEDARVLPFIPYLLQDLENLGTPVKPVIMLLKGHIQNIGGCKILDLACGIGAVGLPIAKETGAAVCFADIMPEFIETAKKKAVGMGLTNCSFVTEDIRKTASEAKDFDIVLLCSAGDVFGNAVETVNALKKTVKKNGYIVIEDAYFQDEEFGVKCGYDYETYSDWLTAFDREGVRLAAEFVWNEQNCRDEINFDSDNANIEKRAAELAGKYPDKRELFEGYVQSQQNECADLEKLKTAIWLLRVL